MARSQRTLLIILGSIVALVILVLIAVPIFLHADNFRGRIESALSSSMGRRVTLGKLDLSVLSGSLVARNATVADDPAFSNQPFLHVAHLKINIEVLPLIFSHAIHIQGFELDSPTINLLRATNGTWNYSTIGAAQKNSSSNQSSSSLIPDLTVGHISITNGQMTVGNLPAPGAPPTPRHTYDNLNLKATNFSFDKAFLFSADAHLPGNGAVTLTGTAGPINPQDASLTPFTAHLEVHHLDPVAVGFLEPSGGVSGTVNSIDAQATWSGQQLHVANLIIDTPNLTVTQSNRPTAAAQPPSAPNSNNMLSTLTADHLQIKNGQLTLTSPGQPKPAVYQQLNAEVTNVSPTASSPFKLRAQVPGGGSITIDGTAGPFNQESPISTPFNAHAVLTHIDLASSGVLAPDAGISGITNADVKATSNGEACNATAIANIQGLLVAKNGFPSARLVDVQLTVAQDLHALTGQIQSASVSVGRAVIHISGIYKTDGPATDIDVKVTSDSASIDELEAFLPSVGVHLPSGSRLQGGTLTTNLHVTGTTAAPVISGPVLLSNTGLAGFDLGSKLSAITRLTGGKTGANTAIRSLSTNVNINGGNVRTDNLALDVPSLGTASGSGTISASGALNYNLVLKPNALTKGSSPIAGFAGQILGSAAGTALGGLSSIAFKSGIPIAIGGTTSSPTFAPNLNGLLGGGSNSSRGKSSSPAPNRLKSLGGLFGK